MRWKCIIDVRGCMCVSSELRLLYTWISISLTERRKSQQSVYIMYWHFQSDRVTKQLVNEAFFMHWSIRNSLSFSHIHIEWKCFFIFIDSCTAYIFIFHAIESSWTLKVKRISIDVGWSLCWYRKCWNENLKRITHILLCIKWIFIHICVDTPQWRDVCRTNRQYSITCVWCVFFFLFFFCEC